MSLESLLAGRVLADRYRIEEVIGRGGMGAVYRATDERLGRAVAVKVITVSGGNDPGARERIRARFRHEAASAARLPHDPNVVPVYDYGTDPVLGLDFLVMELLRGEDLASLLARSGPPPLPTGLRILEGAARGVAVGHRARLIHRDVKPGNIFLVRSEHGEAMQVRVLDFGIAKLVAEEETHTQLTQDGRAPLSPAYASPEQLRGEQRLAPASDVFSLGAVGFQLLTGERPFSDADRNRMGIGLPVPVPSLRARNPAIPPSVEEAVQRALAPDPADRFPDAGALAAALERARDTLGDAPLPAYLPSPVDVGDDRTEFADADADHTLLDPRAQGTAPPPPVAPASRSRRRREPARGGIGRVLAWTALLVLIGGAALLAWWSTQEPRGRRVTEVEPVVIDSLPEPEPVPVFIEPEVPDETDALVNNLEGVRMSEEGDIEGALEQFRRAAETVPNNPEYRNNYAWALYQVGETDEAADELEEVIELDPNREQAYANLAEARLELGDTAAAVGALERYLDLSTDPEGRGAAQRRLREIQFGAGPSPDAPPLDVAPSIPFPDTLSPSPKFEVSPSP